MPRKTCIRARGICSIRIDLLWFGACNDVFLLHHSVVLYSNTTPLQTVLKSGLLETDGYIRSRKGDWRIFLEQTLFLRQCFDLQGSHCEIFTLKYMSNFFLLLQTPSLLQGQVQVSLGMQSAFLEHCVFLSLDYTHWCLAMFSKVCLFVLGFV